MGVTLIQEHTPTKSKSENDIFEAVNDLFVGDSREIDPKYLGTKNKNKGKFSEHLASGYLYVLNARGTDLYKIGISGNINRRLRDISASSPLPILMCFSILIKNPHQQEAFLHKYYSDFYFKNDWFSLSQEKFKELHSFFDLWKIK